jgi:toxin ParE1/3/4
VSRLAVAAQARTDLQDIHDHVTRDHPEAARRLLWRLRLATRKIAAHPGLGRDRSHDPRHGLFSFPVGRYVIFYRIQAGGTVIVRVIHGSRDIPSLF